MLHLETDNTVRGKNFLLKRKSGRAVKTKIILRTLNQERLRFAIYLILSKSDYVEELGITLITISSQNLP